MAPIDLDPDSEDFIRREIAAGRYHDERAVIRAGLSRLMEDGRDAARLGRLLAESYEDPRPSIPMEAVFDRLTRKQANRSRS